MPQRRPPASSDAPSAAQERTSAVNTIADRLLGPAGSRRDVVSRLGGSRTLAGALGVSQRTVQRWARGDTRDFRNPQARNSVRQADARARGQGRKLFGPSARKTNFQARRANVKVKSDDASTLGYEYVRNIGNVDGGPELPADLLEEMTDRIGLGDNEGAMQALEEHLTTDFIGLGENDYDPDAGTGMFLLSLEDASFDNDDDLPS